MWKIGFPRLHRIMPRRKRGHENLPRRLDDALAAGIARHGRRLERALRRGQVAEAQGSRQAIEQLLAEGRALEAIRDPIRAVLAPKPTDTERAAVSPALGITTYWVSSSSLALAHAHLTRTHPDTRTEPEYMLAATGLRLGSLRTLETLIDVKLASQSGGRASFDMRHFTEVAMSLMDHGQALHGIFHSHRFSGPPSPSGVDRDLQRVLDEGGYPAIQAVFSDDGYVRFFAHRPFAIRIYGKGVEHVEGHLYRIVHFGTLPHPTLAS